MDAFSLAYFIAVGLLVLAVWALIIADAIGHYADRWGSRIRRLLARIRDREIRAAAKKWHVRMNPSFTRDADRMHAALAPSRTARHAIRRRAHGGEVRPWTPREDRTTDPRTDHS